MTISEGQRLPDAKMIEMGANGPKTVDLAARIKGRKVVMFGLPGAFTGTCSTIHLPSFVRTAEAFRGKGVDEIICVSVNDPFVLSAWAESSGGKAAGIAFLGDPDAGFTKALKMEFTPRIWALSTGRRAMPCWLKMASSPRPGLTRRANVTCRPARRCWPRFDFRRKGASDPLFFRMKLAQAVNRLGMILRDLG